MPPEWPESAPRGREASNGCLATTCCITSGRIRDTHRTTSLPTCSCRLEPFESPLSCPTETTNPPQAELSGQKKQDGARHDPERDEPPSEQLAGSRGSWSIDRDARQRQSAGPVPATDVVRRESSQTTRRP